VVSGRRYTAPELLKYWISERELIRRAREAGLPKPWSSDPIFQRTYFTNVHREDDRVTRWIRSNYTPEIFGEFYEPAIVAARIFNYPPTLERFKFEWFPVQQEKLANDLEEWGRTSKTWGSAYVITTHGRKMKKVDYCVELLMTAQEKLPVYLGRHSFQTKDRVPYCADYHKELMKIDGLGSFLAAQIVADFKNTEGHPLQDAPDWSTFSAHGPGSLRGLSWYHGKKITPAMYDVHVNMVADDLQWTHCMQDLQNCLCEFDKYCRIITGSGRSKRNYDGI
jgi:hypothetical protein